jgi:hydroxymethylpyrimidine pyrophosphatase-like HAD family hydrolase
MLAPLIAAKASRDGAAIPLRPLPEEIAFYERHAWSLNPHLKLGEAHRRLREELMELQSEGTDWRRMESAVNAWLLASAILNAADERLRGKALKLPKPLAGRASIRKMQSAAGRFAREDGELRRWRDAWSDALQAMLPLLLPDAPPSAERAAAMCGALRKAIEAPLPRGLDGERLGVPSPFQRLDLMHRDVIALADRLIARDPDRATRFVLIGLRTSGTYFAPLIKARLQAAGYRDVALATLEPNKGAGRAEMRALQGHAAQDRIGVLVDDPPDTGSTLFAAVGVARAAGFKLDRLRLLVPTHPAARDWAADLADGLVVSLAPEDWHKPQLLKADRVQARLAEYLPGARVIESEAAAAFTSDLCNSSPDPRMPRLKRVYEVETGAPDGSRTRLFVIAKSVGCGWLSYPAFLAAHRLAGHVAPVLGLRDGILYSRYIPGNAPGEAPDAETAAAYVAARVRTLAIGGAAGMDLKRHNNGVRLLEKALSRAYGGALPGTLMRAKMGARLRALPCPVPTWIDGNMRADEWIATPDGWLKTDFEHHGIGKGGLNVTDPAFDLAESLLECGWPEEAARECLAQYAIASGDSGVEERMLVNKLMAGLWSMNRAQERLLGTARSAEDLHAANRRFIAAWHFLTVETARHAGRWCKLTPPAEWRGPLVFLDVDGVIDRRVFGFPATSAAGLRALAALNRHRCSVVLNTARSVAEVKAYCEAYALAGGVAEYGAYLWDAVHGQGRVLVDDETMRQLACLREALRAVPGVFLDDRHHYSIRAFTYRDKPEGTLAGFLRTAKAADVGDGAVAPLSPIPVKQLMHELGLDRLRVHETTIDTTIVARGHDKGTGLRAMRDWVGCADCETVAVGDSEADLAMFRAASRSFAPANIGCAQRARLLGCEIVDQPYQRGLLQIARRLGASCVDGLDAAALSEHERLIVEVFDAADAPWKRHLFRALRDPASFRIFWR